MSHPDDLNRNSPAGDVSSTSPARAQRYRGGGPAPPQRVAPALRCALPAAALVGIAAGLLQVAGRRFIIDFPRQGLAIVAAALLGWTVMRILWRAKVAGGPAAALVCTASWLVHLQALITAGLAASAPPQFGRWPSRAELILWPPTTWDALGRAHPRQGLEEAAVVMSALWSAVGLAAAARALHRTPFCERCRRWLPDVDANHVFTWCVPPGRAGDLRRELEAGDLSQVLPGDGVDPFAEPCWMVTLRICPRCCRFHALSVLACTPIRPGCRGGEGRARIDATELVPPLMLPHAAAARLGAEVAALAEAEASWWN